MKTSRVRALSSLLVVPLMAALFVIQFAGCSDSTEGEAFENRPPQVWLASGPPEGTTDKYTIQFYWGGWDPDGEIDYYEYVVTNNENGEPFDPADTTDVEGQPRKWRKVFGNDSLFYFTADQLVDTLTTDMVSVFTRSHTFFIRAVDRDGMASTEPAYRSFTARTLSPEVRIKVPIKNGLNAANVPPITTFSWEAFDYVDDKLTSQAPDSVQWILLPKLDEGYEATIDHIRENQDLEWADWRWYKAPGDSGKFWTTPPMDLGDYIFAIRAKDEAGAVTPVLDEDFNVRRVKVAARSTGPILTTCNQYMGCIVTSAIEPPAILDIPAGVPLSFNFNASAKHYGGVVSGYRYGWDMTDLNDPDQWDVDWTPFTNESNSFRTPERTFYFGTHTFTVEVVDNSGFISRVQVKVNIVQFTMDKNLIVIDDDWEKSFQAGWFNFIGKGVMPNDDEHDAFWLDMLDDLAGFQPAADMLDIHNEFVSTIPLTKLASYKSMIWSVRGHVDAIQDQPMLHELIEFQLENPGVGSGGGKKQPNILALFMAAGGHVFLAGQHPASQVINRQLAGGVRYPLIYKYELTGIQNRTPNEAAIEDPPGDQAFPYKELCIDVVDFALMTLPKRRTNDQYCSIIGERNIGSDALRTTTMREAIPLDPNFPRLSLRPETAGPGKAHHESVQGLNCEVYNPQYFLDLCEWTPRNTRDCFEPIYGLHCLDPNEATYGQPVGFWTSVFGDKVADAPDAVAARSAVFGFSPVLFNPDEVKPAVEYIIYEEWQLPRISDQGASAAR